MMLALGTELRVRRVVSWQAMIIVLEIVLRRAIPVPGSLERVSGARLGLNTEWAA